jgi:hypothetical protein
MRFFLAAVAAVGAAAVAGPAFAVLAPQYYQEARDTARDVVVFKVDQVDAERPADGYGTCMVTGTVESVERGGNYTAGGPIRVQFPCMWPHAAPMAGGVIWQTPAELRASHRGRAWMQSPGRLALFQYEILP